MTRVMHRQDQRPGAERFAILAAISAAHILLLLLILASTGRLPPQVVKSGTLSIVSIKAEQAASTPPPPPSLPSELADKTREIEQNVFSTDPDSTSTAAAAAGCSMLEVVTNAMLASPEAIAAVANAPRETRSIADAIVMWNVDWSSAATSVDAPLGVIRSVAEQSLRSVEDGCLDEDVVGPRLIPIPVGTETRFLVFGSGNWRWRQLMFGEDRAGEAFFYANNGPGTVSASSPIRIP